MKVLSPCIPPEPNYLLGQTFIILFSKTGALKHSFKEQQERFWCIMIKTFLFYFYLGDALLYWSTCIWIDNVYCHLDILRTYIFYDIKDTKDVWILSSLVDGIFCVWEELPWGRNGGNKSKPKLLALQGLVTKRLEMEMAKDLQPQPRLSKPGSSLLFNSGVHSTATAIICSCCAFW